MVEENTTNENKTQDLFNALSERNANEASNLFDEIMKNKIEDEIEDLKREIAQKIFNKEDD